MPEVSIDSDELDTHFTQTFDVKHGYVRGFSYFWRETLHTGYFGPQNGAVFKLVVYPLIYPAGEYNRDDSAVSLTIDADWYFHSAYGVYQKYSQAFVDGPMREFNGSSPYHMRLNNYGNIEPGHYMFAVECRAQEKIPVQNDSVSTQIITKASEIISSFRDVVKQLWPGSLDPNF